MSKKDIKYEPMDIEAVKKLWIDALEQHDLGDDGVKYGALVVLRLISTLRKSHDENKEIKEMLELNDQESADWKEFWDQREKARRPKKGRVPSDYSPGDVVVMLPPGVIELTDLKDDEVIFPRVVHHVSNGLVYLVSQEVLGKIDQSRDIEVDPQGYYAHEIIKISAQELEKYG